MTKPNDLIPMIRRNVQGSPRDQAALGLLIGHGTWLNRPDWVRQCIEVLPEEELLDPNEPVAWIDWNATRKLIEGRKLTASTSELNMLSIAASLVTPHEICLGTATSGLDRTNLTLVLNAIKTANQMN